MCKRKGVLIIIMPEQPIFQATEMYDHLCFNLINETETPILKVLYISGRQMRRWDQISIDLRGQQNQLKGVPRKIPASLQ